MSFHVPERCRMTTGPMGSDAGIGNNGAFVVESPEPGWMLYTVAADGMDTTVPESLNWEHVSVSARNKSRTRVPTWREMCFVKDLFWDDEDVVMQLHPRKSQYVNDHPHVLHLWRHPAIPEPGRALV